MYKTRVYDNKIKTNMSMHMLLAVTQGKEKGRCNEQYALLCLGIGCGRLDNWLYHWMELDPVCRH